MYINIYILASYTELRFLTLLVYTYIWREIDRYRGDTLASRWLIEVCIDFNKRRIIIIRNARSNSMINSNGGYIYKWTNRRRRRRTELHSLLLLVNSKLIIELIPLHSYTHRSSHQSDHQSIIKVLSSPSS